MILENFSIGEFLGIIFFMPLLIWLPLVLFDGIGIFKDAFYTSYRSTKKKEFKRKIIQSKK